MATGYSDSYGMIIFLQTSKPEVDSMITLLTENKEFPEILEVLINDGLDGMPKVFEMLMNMAWMESELPSGKIEKSERRLRAIGSWPKEAS